ncbi:MAG TPA: hypothetical protein VIH87_02845 [Methylocella sp.]
MSIGNGVNLQPAYYGIKGAVDFGWNLLKDPVIETVRIEIEPHRPPDHPHPLPWAIGWIQQACGHGKTVIATYHDNEVIKEGATKPNHDVKELMAAANWWWGNYNTLLHREASHLVQMHDTLPKIAEQYYGDPTKTNAISSEKANTSILKNLSGSVGQTLIIPPTPRRLLINLMNEWGDKTVTANQYADAYNPAIKIVRQKYPADQPIIIDVPGGQETAVAASAVNGPGTDGGTDGGAHGRRINDGNFILSVHIYPGSKIHHPKGSSSLTPNRALTIADLDDLASAKRPCMIGEFGVGGPGMTDVKALVSHAKSIGWPVLGWAWNGDDTALKMNMVAPSWQRNVYTPVTGKNSAYWGAIYPLLVK